MGSGKQAGHMEKDAYFMLIEEHILRENFEMEMLSVPTDCLYTQTGLFIADLLRTQCRME
jgi:hypothetical protein